MYDMYPGQDERRPLTATVLDRELSGDVAFNLLTAEPVAERRARRPNVEQPLGGFVVAVAEAEG